MLFSLDLNEEIFGVKTRPHLLHQTVVMQLANRRAGSASTKSKGFVSGGGKKPWRQKGTGRARAGSIRSPILVGGGTMFGPQPRDYSYRMPRSARREALLSALSLKHQDGKIVVVDKFELEQPKTKLMVKALAELKVESAFIVIAQPDAKIERSARNLPKVKVSSGRGVECLRSAALRTSDFDRRRAQVDRGKVGRMKGPQDVIRAPLISEKGTALTESANQVLFKVRPDANKIEVKQAVETLFKVKVEQVRMARYLGKVRRVGRSMGAGRLGKKPM